MDTDQNKRKLIPLWRAGTPTPDRPAAGFKALTTAEHITVFDPSRKDGAYNHHPKLTRHAGTYYAMWSNHPHGEDGPGQRVLYATSKDGRTWSDAAELFPAPGPIRGWDESGLAHTAGDWFVVDGVLYGVALLHDNIGYTDPNEESPPQPRRDNTHNRRARKGYSPVVREVHPANGLGIPFPLRGNVPEKAAYELTAPLPAATTIAALFCSPARLTHWDFEGLCGFPQAYDGHRLCEPTTFRDADGRWVMLLRDSVYSHRMFISYYDENTQTWSPGEPTDIPDSPSLSCTPMLADGTVLLIGNQCAPAMDNGDAVNHYPRDPLLISVSRDGKTFDRAYALRYGQHEWNVPISEVHGRGSGYQYPDAHLEGDTLYVVYSIGKERIAVSRVVLSEIVPD